VLAPEGGGVWREYAGGYSDMLAQRGADLARDKPKGGKAKAQDKTKPKRDGSNRGRLSFKQKHALETLPGEIERLRAEARKLEDQLADPDFYSRDPDAFERTTVRLGEVHQALSDAEDRWLELEMLREGLEDG